MLRRLLITLLFPAMMAVAALAFAAPAGADPVFPTGLRVGLELPPGLTKSHRIPGFEDPAHHVVVAIFVFPGVAYDQLKGAGFQKETQSMTDVSKADFKVAGGPGFLVSGGITVKGRKERRWFLLAKPEDAAKGGPLTAVIRVDVPDEARSVYSDAAVQKMLVSTVFRPTPTQELLGMLPFKIGNLAGFQVAHIMPVGAILTDGPADQAGKIGPPYMIVAVGRGVPSDSGLQGKFARDMLRNGPLSDVRVTSTDKIRVDRAPTIELRADAMAPGGKAVSVVQWMRFGTTGFMRIVGVAPKNEWDKLFIRFRAVRDGISAR